MRNARGARVVATAALLLVAASGCFSGGANDTTVSPTPPPSSSASTAERSTPPSGSELASETASDVVRAYFTTIDQIRQDANRPESDLDAVASSTELTAQRNLLSKQRESGLLQVGETTLVEVNVESTSLDDPATVLVDVCWDVSAVDVLDGDGESVLTPKRKNVGWTRLIVTNDSWETAPVEGWRVSGGSDLEREPCIGS